MSDEENAIKTAEPSGPITVVGLANRQRLAVFLGINLVLVVVGLAQLAGGTFEPAIVALVVIASVAVPLLISLLRHPLKMTVADGSFSLYRTRQPQACPIQDVVGLDYDAGAARLTFRSLAHFKSKRLRSRMESKFARHGHHLEFMGPFSAAQINEVRAALGMQPLPEIQPGSRAAFQAESRRRTPHVFVAPILVAANVIVFVAMALCNPSRMQPTAVELVRWGANFGPLTSGGQAWRLLTAMFLHAGLLHLLVNMLVLALIGPFVERLLGNLGFAIVYTFSGLWGSIVSVQWHPAVVAVGASGAIYGVYGALGALLLHRSLPQHVIRRYRRVAIAFVVVDLIFGMSDKHIDVAAHLGGLAAGFVVGLALGRRSIESSAGRRWLRPLLTTLAGAASVAVAVHLLSGPTDDFNRELQLFSETDRAVLARTYDAENSHQQGTLSDAEFVAVLQAEGIDRWGPALDRISRLKNVPQSQRDYWQQIVRYAELRQEGWQLLVRGVRDGDRQAMNDARAKQIEANAIATAMAKSQKSD